LLKKVLKIATGFGLVIIGLVLALPLVPGPGIPIAVMGLVILSEHFPWAKRIVDWGKEKLEGTMARFKKPAAPPPPDVNTSGQ
jgi:hypothetical protein